MYNTYTIGELAKILGITAETIRYYERKGIIAPIHDQETGYRYYTTWDLHMLIRARCYLGFGLSIEETAGILQSKSLEEIDDLLEEQEQIIQKNIIYQMNLLKRLRTNRKLISRSENLNFTLQKRPGIYRIDTQKCYTIDLKKKNVKNLKNFVKKYHLFFLRRFFLKNILKMKIRNSTME